MLVMALVGVSGCHHRQLTITPRASGVDLTVHMPNAEQVQFLSSSRHFQPLRATEIKSGYWQVHEPVQQPFRYFYQVDGRFYLPDCPQRELDDFGSQNCIYDPGSFFPNPTH